MFSVVQDIGAGKGKYYAVNIPLRDGMDDESYESIFEPIIAKVMETFQPSAVVLQCGADSLTGDRLGCFNLTVKGKFSKIIHFVSMWINYIYERNSITHCNDTPTKKVVKTLRVIIALITLIWPTASEPLTVKKKN